MCISSNVATKTQVQQLLMDAGWVSTFQLLPPPSLLRFVERNVVTVTTTTATAAVVAAAVDGNVGLVRYLAFVTIAQARSAHVDRLVDFANQLVPAGCQCGRRVFFTT